jgi:hypothetical protein
MREEGPTVTESTNPQRPDAHNDLGDDLVKLVAFTIVSVRRGAERAMPGMLAAGSVVITDSLTGQAFSSWVIQRYLSSLTEEERAAIEPDRKYLRVHYVISRRWPREPLAHERDQVAILEGIGDSLKRM